MNPFFFRGLDQFKRLLGDILTPKKSFNEGELVTGEGTDFYVIWGEEDISLIYYSNDMNDLQVSSRY